MGRQMWMGPRGGETWVPSPSTGLDFSPVGWSSSDQYLSGGAGVRRSHGSHMEYNLAWNAGTRDSLRPITDMYDGKRGPGLTYMVDKMASAYNVLPRSWAFPALACYDAIPLTGDHRPVNTQTVANTFDYPMESAQYSLGGTSRSIYLPIPPGFTAWVGVHGSTNGWGGVRVRETIGATGYGAITFPSFLTVTQPERFSEAHQASAVCTGIEIDLEPAAENPWGGGPYPAGDLYPDDMTYPSGGEDFTAAATSIILSGLMVQILPSNSMPSLGDFVSGQGNSGCDFDSAPKVQALSAVIAGAEVSMTAKLVEVGDWL